MSNVMCLKLITATAMLTAGLMEAAVMLLLSFLKWPSTWVTGINDPLHLSHACGGTVLKASTLQDLFQLLTSKPAYCNSKMEGSDFTALTNSFFFYNVLQIYFCWESCSDSAVHKCSGSVLTILSVLGDLVPTRGVQKNSKTLPVCHTWTPWEWSQNC